MTEQVCIRSIRDYFQEFGVHGIGKGANAQLVKQQIMDAFRKEIFDQIAFKLNVADISEVKPTASNQKTVENIMRNSYKKWLGLIREFNKYRETCNLLFPGDLQLFEKEQEMYDPLDGFDDEDELFCEAEDPEDDGGREIADTVVENAAEELLEAPDGGLAAEANGPGQSA